MTSAEGGQVVLAETRKVMVEVEGTQVVLAIMGVTQVVMAKVKRMKFMFSELRETEQVGRSKGDTVSKGISCADKNDELQNGVGSGYTGQFLNNDVLESIIKITLKSFPFMRTSLRGVNSFFRETVNKIPCPTVYIPELAEKTVVISIRKLVMLKGRYNSAVERLRAVIKSPKWYHAWVRLVPLEFGWFAISGNLWKNIANTRK